MSIIALPMAELKPALVGLGKVIDKKSALHELRSVKVERTQDGWIALTVTDITRFATVRLEQPAHCEPAAFLVPFEDLTKIAKACLRTDTLSIWSEKNASEPSVTVTISYPVGTQTMETKVNTVPVEQFPEIPRIKGEAIPIPETLRSSIHEAAQCASTDETRFVLNSVYVDVSQAKCHQVVGTNGQHLYASNSFSLPLTDSLIIPTHRFLEWNEFSKDGEWQIRVGEKPDKDTAAPVQIASRRWRYITRQIDGNFPNWRHAIPPNGEYKASVTIDLTALESLVCTIERLPDHDLQYHTIGIELKGAAVNLLCKATKEAEWTQVPVNGAVHEGADIITFVNREYLVKALEFGLNRLDLIDPRAPLRFSNEGRQMVVMPVLIDGPVPTALASSVPPAAEVPASVAEVPESSGPDEVETVNSETDASAVPPAEADQKVTSGSTAPAMAPLDAAVEQIETIRDQLRDGLRALGGLVGLLKQANREQRGTDREIQSIRTTLEKLQAVRI